MITKENFREKIKGVNIASFPSDLRELHSFVIEATENGSNWNAYNEEDVKYIIDTYFDKLNKLTASEDEEKKEVLVKKQTNRSASPSKEDRVKKEKKVPTPRQDQEQNFELVERIPEEIRFIRRFLSFNGKRKAKEDFLRFINALHKAIIEKRIRKSSRYAKEINHIQENLIKTYNTMSRPVQVEINDKTFLAYKELVKSEKVLPSVALIKRYINLNGKYGVKDKANALMDAMKRAYDKGHVRKSDKYIAVFDRMFDNLKKYVRNKGQKILDIEETELNGLNGVLESCGCQSMNGFEEEEHDLHESIIDDSTEITSKPNTGVMNSMDFKNVQFKTVGFVGKYRQLIGDPSQGFTAMVYGRPKMGKSFLCVDFAGYLARNHGHVLYIAKEEGLDFTLQEKLKAKDVAHENLFVSDNIPEDLSMYDYIFLDSVNRLGLSTQDLQALKRNNPGKSFIYIFQTTKDGNFRGANEFQHDVDVVIEVPEVGLAVQHGRFNQGGQMKIFPDASGSTMEGRPSPKKAKHPIQNVWPDTQYLTAGDLYLLEQVKRYYDEGDMEMAMYMAMRGETEVREAIPPDVWKKMGGMLTPTGEEKLRKMQGK
jgi:hypothetical protein